MSTPDAKTDHMTPGLLVQIQTIAALARDPQAAAEVARRFDALLARLLDEYPVPEEHERDYANRCWNARTIGEAELESICPSMRPFYIARHLMHFAEVRTLPEDLPTWRRFVDRYVGWVPLD